MKVGVLVFPGSNCDHDVARALKIVGAEPVFLWHKDSSLQNVKAVVLPGGFSYGDYLRCGAIAKNSPLMREVVSEAKKGLPVLGICNGFQILTEAGLLPGVLMRNRGLKFICRPVDIRLESTHSPFTNRGQKHATYQIPIAHMEGNYFIDEDGLKKLQDQNQIAFRYVGQNPNGALDDIAGVTDATGRILGLMPHPERVVEQELGGAQGRFVFESLLS